MGFDFSLVSILHSIMLNFDWVYDMLFVYRGKTKRLPPDLTRPKLTRPDLTRPDLTPTRNLTLNSLLT